MASFRKLLLLSALVAGTVAVPVQRGQCARYCTDGSDFDLIPGSTYTYDYETTAVTTVQSSSQDKTQLQMTAQVDIEVVSKCDLALRLRNVILKLSDPKNPDYLVVQRGTRQFSREIENKVLHFSYQNGQIEHVCPSENVPDWVTNIQKGVLSAFQTYTVKPDWTTRTSETDILGKCTAEYHSLGKSWQGMHTIRKRKDLGSCTDREEVRTFLQGMPYSQDFASKSLPALKGSQECEQVIGDGHLQSSTCSESLVFRPFSARGNGVATTVTQKLTHSVTTQRSFSERDCCSKTQLLTYTHAKSVADAGKAEEEAEAALKDLCDAAHEDITISVPRKFSSLVYKMKNLPLKGLKTIFHKTEKICPGNTKARKFFMDAIPLVSTADSARFMFDMITSKAVPDAETNFWLTSLAFINEPTPEMILTFVPLLDGRYQQAILGISSVIRNYCSSKDCSNVPEIQTAVHKLFENLGENCFSPEDKKIILSLKAIGNIGQLFGKKRILEACYKNPQIRNEVRLAAIEAFRRVGCDVSRDDLLNTYRNYDENTEIRIAAYLGVMRCPTASHVEAVRTIMMGERINNVGSFVWTHLNAVSRTQHPERQTIRDIVSNLYLMNKFGSDARKFSSAHEATYFLEALDSGIHVDSHLIFSTDSYLPKTAMFNLTVDVFGKTCNLLQVDGRMEGLEEVVERFFGPSGYFPQKNVAKLLREKRSVDNNKLDRLTKMFNENRVQQQPYGSLDIKVFGTSMWYNQYRHVDDGTPEINILDIITKLAQEQEKEFSRSFMFLDTTFTVPMTSGLPLKIALNGTASVALKIGGKFDVKSFERVDILGHFEPSGAVEIASLLTVDAGPGLRSGMRVVSSLHSSSLLDGRLEVRNGQLVRAQLNVPRDRIDIFNVESKVYLVHGAEEREKPTSKKATTQLQSCTGQGISKVLGVQMCSELEVPPSRPHAALHPLNGAARFSLYIQKTDPKLSSYNFDAQWKSEEKDGGSIKYGILALNTPGSQIDRDLRMEFSFNQPDRTANFKLKTPMKKIAASAKFMNEENQKKLDFGLTMDDKEYFSLQSELKKTSENNAVTYTPSLEIRVPSGRIGALTGSAVLKHGQRYTGQLKIEDLTQKPIITKVNFEVGKRDRYDVEVSLSSFAMDGTVKGYTQMGDSMSSRIAADYRIMEGKMNKLSIVSKVRNLSANALTKYTGLLNIQASVLPEWNTEVSFETMKTTGHVENTIAISLGDGAKSRVHTIKMQEILRYEGSLSNNKVDASLTFAYPEKGMDYAFTTNHENTENSLKNKLQLQYNSNKKINAEVDLKVKNDKMMFVSGDLKLNYPGRSASFQTELSQTNDNEYRGAVTCQWQEGRKASLVAHFKDKCEGGRLKYEMNGNVELPSMKPITFVSTVGYFNQQYAYFSEVNFGSDKYLLRTEYSAGSGLNHRVSGQLAIKDSSYSLDAAIANVKGKLSCNAEVKMPRHRRATAKLEGRISDSLKIGSFEVFWDADRDPSKYFVTSAELSTHNDGYDGKVNIQFDRRLTIKGLVTTSIQGKLFSSQWKTNNKVEIQWSPRNIMTILLSSNALLDRSQRQVNGHLEFTSPYASYENLTLNIGHLSTNQQWDSEISTLLPRGDSVVISSNGKYSFNRGAIVDTTVKMQSSFRNFEEVYFAFSHDHNSRQLLTKAQAQWSMNKRIQYMITGRRQASVISGSVQLTSPFYNYQDLSATINHDYTGGNYKTRGEIKWDPTKIATFTVDGKHELSGRRRICSLNFEGTTPFRGYESTTTKIIYSNDGISVNMESEATWNRNKVSSSLSGTMRNHLYNKNLEGKLRFTSPFRNYENVQMSSSLKMTENSYKFDADAQLPYRSTASINTEGTMLHLNDLELNAVIISNFPKPQRVSVDVVHKLHNSKLRSTFDASYGNDRLTILLIGVDESEFNSRNVEFSATVNTPFSGYEEIKMELIHNRNGYEYDSKLNANKNKLSGSLTHKLKVRDISNFESTLEMTTTANIPHTKVSIVHSSNRRQMEHTSYILWSKNKKIHVNAQYSDKSLSKEATMKITTPFRNYADFELKAKTESQDWGHKGVISTTWNKSKKMTLSGDFKNVKWESLVAQLEFTSPFKTYELFSTSLRYDTTSPQKNAQINLLWDAARRREILLKFNFLHSSHLSNLEMLLSTPFQDFEKISFTTNLNNRLPERILNVVYERGLRKLSLTGKTVSRNNQGEITLDIQTPYEIFKEFSASAKYNKIRNALKTELESNWNKKYTLNTSYEWTPRSYMKGNLVLTTPHKNYENVAIQLNGNKVGSDINSKLDIRWNVQKISLDLVSTLSRESGTINLQLNSTLGDFKNVDLSSRYSLNPGSYEGELKTSFNKIRHYSLSVGARHSRHHIFAEVRLDSPHTPMRNVHLNMQVNTTSERNQLRSVLKWEEKSLTFDLSLNKNIGRFYEAKMNLKSSIESLKTLNFESVVNNDGKQNMNGRILIATPFDILRNFDVYGEIKDGSNILIKMNSPVVLNIQGSLSNNRFNPLTASLDIDAPFLSFKKISTKANLNIKKWNNIQMEYTMTSQKSENKLNFDFQQDNKKLHLKIKPSSTLFLTNDFTLELNSKYEDPSRVQVESYIEGMGKVHSLNGLYSAMRKTRELSVELESPFLPEGKAETTIKLDALKSLEVTFTVPSSTHRLSAKYENKGNEVTCTTQIDSELLKSNRVDIVANYVNVGNHDVQAKFSINADNTDHGISVSLKNNEEEKFAQLKINCPMSKLTNPLTVTGEFKNRANSQIDSSFSISTMDKEFRIAGNMKNTNFEDVEAFITVNTPFEVLKMVRLDGYFKNKQFRNLDANFKLSTSNPKFSSLELTSKLMRSTGSEDMSLMLRLPFREFNSIQVLGNVHYNLDYSNADTRVTLTLPKNKYAVYGQYGWQRSRISGRGEIELDSSKWGVTGRLDHSTEKKDIFFTLEKPNEEMYKAGGAYGNSGNRQEFAVTYIGPQNKNYNFNSTVFFDNPSNFEISVQAETQLKDYKNLQGSILQRFNSKHFTTSIEYSKNNGKKGFLKLHHNMQRDGIKGTFQAGCPYHNLKDFKLSYNRLNKFENIENSISLDYNRVNRLKMEIIVFGEKSSHVVLDVPSLSWTVTGDSKKLDSGREIILKSTCHSRIVSFRTTYQKEMAQIAHDAAFSWDEKHEKRISYEFKLANTETGGEVAGRLDTPLRSLMVKGNFTSTSRATSGGVHFYWDASRSLEKNMAVGFIHTNLSAGKQTSHRLQLILEHSKLAKSIVQTNTFSVSDSELLAKSEFQYSRDQQHHVLLELKASDMSRAGRESHYKAELSARHPASLVDVRATAELIDSRLETHAQLKLSTQDRRMAQNVREVKAKILKLRQEIEILTRLNDEYTTYWGQVTNRGSDTDVIAERRTNENKDVSLQVKLNRRQRLLEATVVNSENVGYTVNAAFPKESISMKVSHTHHGNTVADAELYLGLEQSRILRSKVNWRPIRMRDVKINTVCLRKFFKSIEENVDAWWRDMGEEITSRVPLVSASLNNAMSPLVDDVTEAVHQVRHDVRAAGSAFNRMHSRNEFFMKDIADEYEEIKSTIKEIMNGLSLGYDVLCTIIVEQVEDIYYNIYYKFVDLGEYLEKFHAQMSAKLEKMATSVKKAIAVKIENITERIATNVQIWKDSIVIKFDKWLRSYAPSIIDAYYHMKNAADDIRNFFQEKVTRNNYYVALKSYMSSVWTTFRVVRDFGYVESAQSFISRVYDAQLMEKIANHPSVEYVSTAANSALKKSIEIYHNLGMDVVASAIVDNAVDQLKSAVLQSMQELVSDFYKARAGAKYEFAPARGQISLEFNLPAPRSSLVEVFDFQSYPEFEKMKTVHTLASDYYENFCIWDIYYKVLKYFTPSYWLPAFNAHAILSGNQHYITFDRLAYDFAGRCSYLLARDFADGNFSAIVNYGPGDHTRKSLTVLVDGRKVDVGADYRVTLDDTRVELPQQFGNTVLIREGASVRVENEKKGFSLVCNFVQNYCSVSMSGFYFGKTGGLFGTFNYEPRLDMMTPDRYLKDDVETFARSWEVGQTVCRSSDNLATLPSNSQRVHSRCKDLFDKPSSEFRACFKQVKPDAYYRMCISDLSAVHERNYNNAICDSAAAYFAECKMEGVALRMPAHCVRCERQDGTFMTEGQVMQFPRDGASTVADVVFLVEEKGCNKERIRHLPKVAQGIEESFRQKGYNEVRYSVVGFGGDQIHASPHIHTMEGLESGPLRSLETSLESLEFGDGPINVLEALRFAASLTYRAGSTKRFILVKCSTCKSEEVKAEYSEMLRTLLDSDITLHLLMDQKFEMKIANKNAKARRVIGIDKKFAYTLKDVKDTRGDGDLLPQLRIPKDVCIPLALAVNGSSFDAAPLAEARRSSGKKFMDVLARVVVRSSGNDSPLCCECIAGEDGVGRSVCQRCVSTSVLLTETFSRA